MKKQNVKVNGGNVAVVAEPSKFAKMKASIKRNSKRIIASGLTIIVVGSAVIIYLCNQGKNNTNEKNETPVTDTYKEEEYSRDLLTTRIQKFTLEAKKQGINLTEEEVRDFAAFINIDRIVSEDPELAKELFDGKKAEEILSNAGHMIGTLMTNSFTNNYKKSMNLSTLVVGSDYDKEIMTKLENYRDELTTMRAEEENEHRVEFATKEEEEKFDTIITDVLNFYSMTADGLEINGKNAVIQKMGDGSRFATVLVMNEIALGNRNLLTKKEYKAFQKLMSNEAVVANLENLIEGCQTKELQTTKQKTK